MRIRLILVVLVSLISFGWQIGVKAGNPSDLVCNESSIPYPNPTIKWYLCKYPSSTIYGPSSGFSPEYPAGFLVPTGVGKYPITLFWDGYGDMTNCPTWDAGRPNTIVVKNCPDYYPIATSYKVGNFAPIGFGGPFMGLSPTERFTTAVRKIQQVWNSKADWGDGLTFIGSSYGASTSLLQPLLFDLVDPEIHAMITKVDGRQAPLSFVGPGSLSVIQPNVKDAWTGFDLNLLDHVAQSDKIKNIYFFIVGSQRDGIVPFKTSWFQEVCDAKKISCYGLWHDCGHALAATSCGGILETMQYNMFASSKQKVRLDDPFIVVFTNSSGNIYGPIGGYNIGLSWDNSTFYTDEYNVKMGIKYTRLTQIHPTVADQPTEVSFSLTIRMRPENSNLQLVVGDLLQWSVGEQSGQAVVLVANEVTIPVILQSSTSYSLVSLTKTGHIPGC